MISNINYLNGQIWYEHFIGILHHVIRRNCNVNVAQLQDSAHLLGTGLPTVGETRTELTFRMHMTRPSRPLLIFLAGLVS